MPNLVDKFVEQAGGYNPDNILLKKLPDVAPPTSASDNMTARSNKKVRFQAENDKLEKSFRDDKEKAAADVSQMLDLEVKMKEYWRQRMDAMEMLE